MGVNLSNVIGDFYVSETTVFSNGTVGANLSAGGPLGEQRTR